MSTKIERKWKTSENVEKSKVFIFHSKIVYRTLRNVAPFFPWTWWIEIPCGHRDRRKRRHFSVRCYIQINPHVQFASLLTAYLCSETSLISVKKQFDTKYSPLCRNRNSGEAKYDQNFAWSKFFDSVDFFRSNYLFPAEANLPKLLDLVSRNVGLNSDEKISIGLFSSHSVNLSSTWANGVTEVKRWLLQLIFICSRYLSFLITNVFWMRSEELKRFLQVSWHVANIFTCVFHLKWGTRGELSLSILQSSCACFSYSSGSIKPKN